MFKSKKALISISVLVMAILIMAGTFAWQQTINKVNEFIGRKTDVTVHDDFDPSTGAKDVYVENPSSAEIYVRVKLNEAMNLTSNTWRPGLGDWTAHKSDGELFHNYFTWTMGGQKYYMPSDGSSQVVQDTTQYTGSEPGVKRTPNATIIDAADYLAMTAADRSAFTGWIFDDTDDDGYFYWSQPVGKGEITGLLLHQVTTASSLKNTDYYYAIDVIVEAVDSLDIPMWTQGAASVDGSGTRYSQATVQGNQIINAVTSLSTAG